MTARRRTADLPIAPYANVLVQAAQMVDRKFRVTSYFRSYAAQARLYQAWLSRGKTGLPAAPPGRSMHELGRAIDIARPGVDPFKDDGLAYLGNWWRQAGLGWNESDPVHFQLDPIPQHAAGLASGERHDPRTSLTAGAADLPIHHPAVTRGLNDNTPTAMVERGSQKRPGFDDLVGGAVKEFGSKALGAGVAAAAAGGSFMAGAGAAAAAAAPFAVPALVAAIFGTQILPDLLAPPQMFYTEAGGLELARRIKKSLDIDETTGRATAAKWST